MCVCVCYCPNTGILVHCHHSSVFHFSSGIKCASFKDKKCLPPQWTCAERVVEELRAKILEATGLTASAGIAPNKAIAKIASDMNKPNGQFLVEPTRECILTFIQELHIRKVMHIVCTWSQCCKTCSFQVCGIGKVTEKMLNALGVTICRDLYNKRDALYLVFSPSSARFFLSISLGLGDIDIQRYQAISVSCMKHWWHFTHCS